jgi:hypothetical protein
MSCVAGNMLTLPLCMPCCCLCCDAPSFSADPGLPGRFDDYAKQQSPAIAGFSPSDLHDEHSLIGQLCPGLRLCLAAEVATGLMCDRLVGMGMVCVPIHMSSSVRASAACTGHRSRVWRQD